MALMDHATPHVAGIMDTHPFSPVTLPCSGRAMANRLVKVALYEHLAPMYGGPPNKYHIALYREWAKHDWGMILTGNIQVSRDHLSLGRDVVVPEVLNEETLAPFRKLAQTIHAGRSRELSTRPLAVMQLSHAGRQSPNFVGGRTLGVPPMAPSPLRLGTGKRARFLAFSSAQDMPHPYYLALFQKPREMTLPDIKQTQEAFVRGALTAVESGFDGIQLHCAHGYLFAQFLNPKSNVRGDEYSVEPLRMVREVVDGIRAVVPKDFVVGIKINSADYVGAGEKSSDVNVLKERQRVLDHIRTIAEWEAVDFIEISGGDYESPDFLSLKSASPRQAFFSEFAKRARECLKTDLRADVRTPLVVLTGGLCSPAHLQGALDAGHADLLGIGRGSILRPDLPAVLHQRICEATAKGVSLTSDDEPFAYAPDSDIRLPFWLSQIPLVGATAPAGWYTVRMREFATSRLEKRIDGKAASGPPPTPLMGGIEAIVRMFVWLEWHELIVGGLLICGVTTMCKIALTSSWFPFVH